MDLIDETIIKRSCHWPGNVAWRGDAFGKRSEAQSHKVDASPQESLRFFTCFALSEGLSRASNEIKPRFRVYFVDLHCKNFRRFSLLSRATSVVYLRCENFWRNSLFWLSWRDGHLLPSISIEIIFFVSFGLGLSWALQALDQVGWASVSCYYRQSQATGYGTLLLLLFFCYYCRG